MDLDSNPTKLIEIVEIGKQMLMTRGAPGHVQRGQWRGEYFAIIPAAFDTVFPGWACRHHAPDARASHPTIGRDLLALIIVVLFRWRSGCALPTAAGRVGAAAPQPADLGWADLLAPFTLASSWSTWCAGRAGLGLSLAWSPPPPQVKESIMKSITTGPAWRAGGVLRPRWSFSPHVVE